MVSLCSSSVQFYPKRSQSCSLQPNSGAWVAKGLAKSGKALCSPAHRLLCPSFWECKAILAPLAEENSTQPSDLLKPKCSPAPHTTTTTPDSLGRAAPHPAHILGMFLWDITCRAVWSNAPSVNFFRLNLRQILANLAGLPRPQSSKGIDKAIFSVRHNGGFVFTPTEALETAGGGSCVGTPSLQPSLLLQAAETRVETCS